MPGHPFVPPATAVPSPVQHKALQVRFFAFHSRWHSTFLGPTGKNKTNKQMHDEEMRLRFAPAARPSESKWSPGGGSASNSSLAHELWKVPLPPKALPVAAPSRPPPGLTSQKTTASSSGWDGSALRLGCWGSTESRYTPGRSRRRRRRHSTVLLEGLMAF